jgi:arabinofuranosyltransferase
MIGTLVGIVAITLVFAALGWHRRWIADDGLIVVRTVRNVLAGNGPVYNAFERAEANTSTLWTYVLVAVTGLFRTEPVFTAVFVGWLLSISGVAVAMDATRRMQRARGSIAMLVPAGAFVMIGTQPFWDYATSGLETGLCTFWIASAWWLLVAVRAESRRRFVITTAVVFGLGPLVRPDFAVVSVVFCVALWLLVRPTRRRAIGLAAAALALPVAYEIFRAGYYGVLVPLPAIAKSAVNAEWQRGFVYLGDYMRPYLVYVPMAILAIVGGLAIRRRWILDRTRILVGTSTISALLLAIFVLRVGGDFMHGRMFLPATFMVLLPALVLPLHRITAPALGAIAVWAVAIVIIRSDGRAHATAFRVADERHNYATWTKTEHPTSADVFLAADEYSTNLVNIALAKHEHTLVSEGGLNLAANPAYSQPVMYAVGRLGTGGATLPLDGIVVDVLGLANPLGAHITVNQPGMTGHEKSLPWSWIRADYADPAIDSLPQGGVTFTAIHAARHAMTCGDLAELFASVREPMTSARFVANLVHSLRRTRLVVPSDPFEAETKFCSDKLTVHNAIASSSYEQEGWSVSRTIDGVRTSTSASKGFSSDVGATQWIELQWAGPFAVSKVTLYPRSDDSPGAGFPIDFKIQIWNGTAWIDRAARTDLPNPGTTAQVITWSPADHTDRIRLIATKLPMIGADGPRLQLAEIEAE